MTHPSPQICSTKSLIWVQVLQDRFLMAAIKAPIIIQKVVRFADFCMWAANLYSD